ncbi:MAG TPA: SPOR domain-containing protein [Acetobacteraceae bacterium]|jgi:hypothetical protein
MREDLDIPMPSMGPSYRVSRRRDAMDPNTRRLAIIAGGIGGTLLLLVSGWSLTGRHHGGLPVVEADSRPLKVKPENPGGLQVSGQDESILSGSSTSDSQAALAPAPEVPALSALKAQEQQQQQQLAAATPPPMAAQPVSLNTAQPAATSQTFSSPPIAPTAPKAAVATRQEAPVESKPVESKPVETRPAEARAMDARPAPAKPLAVAKVAAVPPVSGRHPQVQLAALPSERAAMSEWERLEKRDPGLFGGRKPSVIRVAHDGKVFWRLRTGGFADMAQASIFCERIKAKGAGCAVASF